MSYNRALRFINENKSEKKRIVRIVLSIKTKKNTFHLERERGVILSFIDLISTTTKTQEDSVLLALDWHTLTSCNMHELFLIDRRTGRVLLIKLSYRRRWIIDFPLLATVSQRCDDDENCPTKSQERERERDCVFFFTFFLNSNLDSFSIHIFFFSSLSISSPLPVYALTKVSKKENSSSSDDWDCVFALRSLKKLSLDGSACRFYLLRRAGVLVHARVCG